MNEKEVKTIVSAADRMERLTFPVVATGTLSSRAGTSTNATITIHASNTKLVVEVTASRAAPGMASEGFLRFVGHVSGDDSQSEELVIVDKLHVTRRRQRARFPQGALLAPWSEVVFGGEQYACVSLARSVAATLPDMNEVEIGEFVLTIETRKASDVETLLWETSKHLDRVYSTIVLTGPPLSVEQYESAMKEVTTLVGIMLSHSPFTTQTDRGYLDGARSRHVEFSGGLGFGHSKTVASGSHAEFLCSAWPAWTAFDEGFQRALRVSSSYLAASCEGYLDAQLFSTFQAWEVLAKAYVKHFSDEAYKRGRSEHKAELDDLAERLQDAYDLWENELPRVVRSPIENFGGLIESAKRILTPDAVAYMIDRSGLDADRTGLDVVALRQKTNKVRHTGMLPPREEYAPDFHSYRRAKFALELIILKTLGYEGWIKYEEEPAWQIDLIEHFFPVKQ